MKLDGAAAPAQTIVAKQEVINAALDANAWPSEEGMKWLQQ